MSNNNIILSYPNRANGMTFSAGSWLAGLPVANLANRELWKVARSTDATIASTKFQVDLGAMRTVGYFALSNHNLSATAQWRLKLGTTAGAADIFDSGSMAVWRMSFDTLVEWESVTWWLGTAGDEYLRSPYPALCVATDIFSARYITVEITDTANVDGYVQIGRFFAGGGVQPAVNASWGIKDFWRDLSTTDSAESGAFWGTVRRRLRGTSFVLDRLSLTEAGYLHEMQRLLGTTEEVLYIPDPTEMGESQRYGFLGRLSELSPIDYPFHRVRSLPLRIEELG